MFGHAKVKSFGKPCGRTPTRMKHMKVWRQSLIFGLPVVLALALFAQRSNPDVARWEREAREVTIVRDDWGIAHIFGKTDADVVFGTMYAQAEDDFQRA